MLIGLAFGRLKRLLLVSDVLPISRRWFVTNAFDGNLSILGIVLGAHAFGSVGPSFILGAGLGMCVALAISQSTGTIMAERAERVRMLKQLQNSMLQSLDDTIHGDVAETGPLLAGLVGGVLPAAYTSLTLIPYGLQLLSLLDQHTALYSSVAAILLSVFFLGVLLGRISKGSLVVSGLKMLGVGLLTATVLFLVGSL